MQDNKVADEVIVTQVMFKIADIKSLLLILNIESKNIESMKYIRKAGSMDSLLPFTNAITDNTQIKQIIIV